MTHHHVVAKIKQLLEEKNCWFKTFEHKPVRTSEEASKTRPGYLLHQGAKAIIIRVKKSKKDKKFVMLVLPADLRFNNDKVKKYFGSKDIRFAVKEEIGQITGGVEPGGVPPFGNLFNLKVIVDPQLFRNEKIVFNAGDRRLSIAMESKDYKSLVNPEIVNIT